jgi:hypothetical protein
VAGSPFFSNDVLAALVFGAGALYGWETSVSIPRRRKMEARTNGKLEKKKL